MLQEDPSVACDADLPNVTVDDIRLLQSCVPELLSELSLSDPLETSIVVRNCLSQSNLTKIVDPRQNKTLEETLHIREKTLVDNEKLTMSVLKREMSCNMVEEFPFLDNAQFKIGSKEDIQESEFEPSSLRSLSDEKGLVTSSDSDALFHSAELDFSCSLSSTKSPKSVSGKSSSSPITIKGQNVSLSGTHHSRSLSPRAGIPILNNVFSLPIMENLSMTNITRFPPTEMSCSINSSRSLSDAIKFTEVNEGIADSAEIVKKLKIVVLDLRGQLQSVREGVTVMGMESNELIGNFKSSVVERLNMSKHYDCQNCKNTREEIKINRDRHEKEVETVNEKYLETRCEQDILLTEADELKIQLSTLSIENNVLKEKMKKNEEETKNEIACLKNDIEKGEEQSKSRLESIQEVKNHSECLKVHVERLQSDISGKHAMVESLLLLKEGLEEKVNELAVDCQRANDEKHFAETEFAEFKQASEKSNDLHLEHVSTVNIQVKELKKMLAAKDEDLMQVSQVKDSLEMHKQTNFNQACNKIKKEKDNHIRQLTDRVFDLEKTIGSFKHKTDMLYSEINMHKQEYTQLVDELKEEKNKTSLLNEELNNYKNEKVKLEEEFDSHKKKINELTENIEEIKVEKLRVMNELKIQYDEELEKEKSSRLLAFEVEKESALEKSEHGVRSAAISISIE